MIINLYIITSRIFTIFAPFWIFYRSYRKDRYSLKNVKEQIGIASIATFNNDRKTIWIHAASIGEVASIIPLIKHLKGGRGWNFIVTTITASSAKLLTSADCGAVHQFAPLDCERYIKRFLGHWKPDLVIMMESEIWPNTMRLVRERCNLLLLNARISERSFKRWRMIPKTANHIMNYYSLIIAWSQIDLEKYQELGANNVKYYGNLKYAVPAPSADKKMLELMQEKTRGRRIIVYGSIHDDEFEICVQAHQELKRKFQDLLTIIVPRHPNKILHKIDGNIMSCHSKLEDIKEIYIVDTFGELGVFYRLAEVVFVGGSLVKAGGHNILEPLKLGNVVIVGPFAFNFQSMIQELSATGIVKVVNNPKEMIELMIFYLINKDKLAESKTIIEQEMKKYQNMMQKIIENIEQLIC